MPIISVLMPVRNTERYIGRAVRTVLAQEGVDLELVVVDDGSTDRSIKLVKRFGDPRVRIVAGPERGIPAAMNRAVGAARGEFFTRCDGDDFYPSGRLRRQLQWLKQNPAFGVVCGTFAIVSRRGRVLAEVDCGEAPEGGREITPEVRAGRLTASLNTYMWRREVGARVGGFREFFVSGSDVDYQLRMAEVCRTWLVPRCEYMYRLHEESITHRLATERRRFFEETARRMQAQRRATGRDDLERGMPPVMAGARERRAALVGAGADEGAECFLPGRDAGAQRREAATEVEAPGVDAGRESPQLRASMHIQGIVLGHAWREHQRGRRLSALRAGVVALANGPRDLSVWRSVAALAVKPVGGGRTRNEER